MTNIDTLLEERQQHHGDFAVHAKTAQELKAVFNQNSRLAGKTTGSYSAEQLEAIDMILHKVARIVAGDPHYRDHWDDIAGYATLGARSIPVKGVES